MIVLCTKRIEVSALWLFKEWKPDLFHTNPVFPQLLMSHFYSRIACRLSGVYHDYWVGLETDLADLAQPSVFTASQHIHTCHIVLGLVWIPHCCYVNWSNFRTHTPRAKFQQTRWSGSCAVLCYYAPCSGNSLPTFQDNLSVLSSRSGTDKVSRKVGKELPL